MKMLVISLALVGSPLAALANEISRHADALQSSSQSVSATPGGAVALAEVSPKKAPVSQQMKVTVGKQVFTATLQDNATAAAFKALLPLSLNMRDLNRNEKAFDLSSDLPTADAKPRTIRTGDLMIWSSRTVVVFYKGFSTPYSYTRLGQIDDPTGLAESLGAGNVTLTFELK